MFSSADDNIWLNTDLTELGYGLLSWLGFNFTGSLDQGE